MDSTPSLPSTGTTGTGTGTGTGLFSRRPSFFGGRHSRPKTPTSSRRHLSPVPAADNHHHHHDHHHEAPPTLLKTSPRRHVSRHSISSTIGDIGSQLHRSRSASLRTNASSGKTSNTSISSSSHRRTPSTTLALSLSPEKSSAATNATAASSRPALSISTFSRSKQKSAENVRPDTAKQGHDKTPMSAVDNLMTPFTMAMPMRHPPAHKEPPHLRRQDSASMSYGSGLGPAAPIALPAGSNPNIIFQHIHEMASKRISTLDYLRKAHEGRIYWFNTLLFSKSDLSRLPSFTPRNLARRATHYLLLGFSLPSILDLNASSPSEYLKALNALLVEFEQYTSMHPADGSAPSSLGRGRIPGMQMFKRVNVTGKSRRSSSAAEGFPQLMGQASFGDVLGGGPDGPTDDLLPNESYSYLQTPSIPFDPDFFSTFATLCDVLIDCYTKILSLLSSPESIVAASGGVPSTIGELFNKADSKVRKIILASVVREFEESCRQGLKAEVGGVGKVVLGGLM